MNQRTRHKTSTLLITVTIGPKAQSPFSRVKEQLFNALDGPEATRASLDRARFSDKLGTADLIV